MPNLPQLAAPQRMGLPAARPPLTQRAKAAIMHERQARFDETMTAIADGMLDRDEINALPSSWLSVAETRSLIRMDDDGRWILRARFKPTPPSEAVVEGCCVDVDPEEGVEK